jgi:hypothetical protein
MGVMVPTLDEFRALETQVSALEAEAQPQPPAPTPPSGDGVRAKRTAYLVELFGMNTFLSLEADANLWGSYPADYSPASVIDALRWITGDSGFALRIREYHYTGRRDMQTQWMAQIMAALPATRITVCPGANAAIADAQSLKTMPNLTWIEGLNEPNTDFGSGRCRIRRRWISRAPCSRLANQMLWDHRSWRGCRILKNGLPATAEGRKISLL